MPHAVVPPDLQDYVDDWHMSPGLEHEGFMFLTGFTGAGTDGSVPADPEVQIRSAFERVGLVLKEAGLGFEHIVEMTSYHVGLRDHLQTFRRVRDEHVRAPYPAWTAIEVAGFVTEGVVVELRAIARRT
ncbi:MAG: RidA family protein [Pseudomonadota bacterium]